MPVNKSLSVTSPEQDERALLASQFDGKEIDPPLPASPAKFNIKLVRLAMALTKATHEAGDDVYDLDKRLCRFIAETLVSACSDVANPGIAQYKADEFPEEAQAFTESLLDSMRWLRENCSRLEGAAPGVGAVIRKILRALGLPAYEKPMSEPVTITPASGEVARRAPRHRPGYVAPTRENKAVIKTYVSPEDQLAFKAIAQLNGTTSEGLLRDVVAAVIEQHRDPNQVKLAITETVERYQQAINKAALRLVAAIK